MPDRPTRKKKTTKAATPPPEPVSPSDHLAAIVESSDDAIISKTLKGIITSWNHGAEKIFGYSKEEAIGKSIMLIIPPSHAVEERRILDGIGRGERVAPYHTVRQRRDGSMVDVSLSISPIRDAQNRIIGASKIARDITSQVHDEELLRRSEERFRVTLTSIGDGVITTDQKGHITFINPVAEQLTGWAQQDAIGAPLEKVLHLVDESAHQRIPSPVLEVLRTGRVVKFGNDTYLISKDGTRRPVGDSAAPIRSRAGEVFGVVLIFRDVSQILGRAQIAERLAAVVADSSDAIYTIMLEAGASTIGTIRTWNRSAERLLGFKAEEVLGRPVTMLIPPAFHNMELEMLAKLRKGEKVEPHRAQLINRNGRVVDIIQSDSPLRDSMGRLIGVSVTCRELNPQRGNH